MTRSAPPSISASMRGNSRSSCCRSPSMTATTLPADASMPSITAPARPRRPIRRTARTRMSCSPRSRTRRAVPSGLSSSTKMTSHRIPASAASRAAIIGSTFSASQYVGTMTRQAGSGDKVFALTFCKLLYLARRRERARPLQQHCHDRLTSPQAPGLSTDLTDERIAPSLTRIQTGFHAAVLGALRHSAEAYPTNRVNIESGPR